MKNLILSLGIASTLLIAACGKKEEAPAAPAAEAPAATTPAPAAAPATGTEAAPAAQPATTEEKPADAPKQ